MILELATIVTFAIVALKRFWKQSTSRSHRPRHEDIGTGSMVSCSIQCLSNKSKQLNTGGASEAMP